MDAAVMDYLGSNLIERRVLKKIIFSFAIMRHNAVLDGKDNKNKD